MPFIKFITGESIFLEENARFVFQTAAEIFYEHCNKMRLVCKLHIKKIFKL